MPQNPKVPSKHLALSAPRPALDLFSAGPSSSTRPRLPGIPVEILTYCISFSYRKLPLINRARLCIFVRGFRRAYIRGGLISEGAYEGIEKALRKSFSSALLRAAAHNFLYLLVFNEASKMA